MQSSFVNVRMLCLAIATSATVVVANFVVDRLGCRQATIDAVGLAGKGANLAMWLVLGLQFVRAAFRQRPLPPRLAMTLRVGMLTSTAACACLIANGHRSIPIVLTCMVVMLGLALTTLWLIIAGFQTIEP